MPLSREQVRGWRARKILERGGVSPEGVTSPRARRKLTRGGDQPSSEAEPHPRGRPALERGGTSPEGATSPRARWRFASTVLCPSNEAEFRPRVAGPTVLVGRWGHQGRGPGHWAVIYLKRVLGSFAFCFFRKKVSFPWLFRGPLWMSPTVAPEHLRVYPLGSRRC
jgi:hypothetical protein